MQSLITMLGFTENEITVFEYGHGHYKNNVKLGEFISLSFNGPKDREGNITHMLDINGSGCKDFTKRNGNWHNLWNFLISNGEFHFTRIDFACDLINNPRLTVAWMLKKIEQGEYVSPFLNYRYYGSGKKDNRGIKDDKSLTIYLGASTSLKSLVIYDKLKERSDSGEDYLINSWVRFEIRLYGDSANSLINDLLDVENDKLGEYYSKLLFALIDFKNRGNDVSRINDWETSMYWKRFIGDVEKLDYKNTWKNQNESISSVPKKIKWTQSHVARTLINILTSVGVDDVGSMLGSLMTEKAFLLNAVDMAVTNKERVLNNLPEFKTVEELTKHFMKQLNSIKSLSKYLSPVSVKGESHLPIPDIDEDLPF